MYFTQPLADLAGLDYPVIYADPPWTYNDKMLQRGHGMSLVFEYQTQSKDWLKQLPVGDIAAKDCALFIWITSPLTDVGFEVARAWGFKFKTLPFVWTKKTVNGKDVANLGKWTMGSVENCWLFVKGRPQRVARNVRQVIDSQRTIHSAKPDEARQRIVTLMGDVPRIELFARGESAGWDQWGNEPEGPRTRITARSLHT